MSSDATFPTLGANLFFYLSSCGKMKIFSSLIAGSNWKFGSWSWTHDFSLRPVRSLFWSLWLDKLFSPFWRTLCITLFALFCMFLLFDCFKVFCGLMWSIFMVLIMIDWEILNELEFVDTNSRRISIELCSVCIDVVV